MTIALKPLRRVRFWLGLWLAAVLAVIVLSLIPPPPLPVDLPENSDKAEHFIAYFLLAAAAVQSFYRGRALWTLGLMLGMGLEWAQGALTATRMADPFDALANTLGVAAGLTIVFTPLRDVLLHLQPRR